MKILHVLDHSLPLHSGYAFRSQNIFISQQKMGLLPLALTSPKHQQSWKKVAEKEEIIGGVRYYRTRPVSKGNFPTVSEIRSMAALKDRIHKVALLEKPDVLHAHSPILNALPALWVGYKLGIPVVYEIRAFWEDAGVDHGTYREDSWKYKAVRALESLACRGAVQVAVLCQGLKEDLVKRGISHDKLTVVPNGVNVDDFCPCNPDREYRETWRLVGRTVIGFIGSFYRYEGLDLLVDAFARIVCKKPETVLLLIGGGEMENELKIQVRKLALDGRVIMPGRISHERIPATYALIDVLVYPRYSMRLTELVTPLKPLEAMAMGRALIASDVGGHRELIRHGETGLLFSAGEVSALCDRLDLLLGDIALRKQLQNNGPLWVRESRTWGKTSSVYEALYARALSGRS